MKDFFSKLLDTSDFPARWNCGTWSEFHGWLHIVSDGAIFLAYTLIPCVIFYFAMQRKDVQFPRVSWLFCAFIFASGTVHLIEGVIFFVPIYRIAAILKLVTAIVSWSTLLALVTVTPRALKLPSLASLSGQLEKETKALRETQEQLSSALMKLQHSKELTDAIIECVGTGVMVANTNGEIIVENESARQITGMSIGDADPEDLSRSYGMFHLDESTLVETNQLPLMRGLAGESVVGEEYVLNGPHMPNKKFIRVSAASVTNQSGERLGAVLTFDDITKLHEQRNVMKKKHDAAQTGLTQANERLGNIVNSISDVIWSGEVDGDELRFLYFSPRMKTLTGYPAKQFLGDKSAYLDIVLEEDRNLLRDAISSVASRQRKSLVKEYRIVNSDGDPIWIRNRVHTQRDELTGITTVFGVLSNIMEEREARQVLIRAERLAALGTLSAGIAHEINNPLGGMMLTTELAKSQIAQNMSPIQVNSTLDKVIDQISRCSSIVSNVLQFAKNEESAKASVDIFEIAVRARDMVAFRARANNNTVILESQCEDCLLFANSTGLEQVLINLLANAIDASANQAKILLMIVETCKNELEISVHDSGPGMDEKTKLRAFDPFFTCRRESGGTGLGLSMCHSIVARHNGRIDILTSDELGGTNVRITIPRINDAIQNASV